MAVLFLSAFRLPVQQQTPQQVPNCTKNPIKLNPTAIHMKANIGVPKLALILTSVAFLNVFLKITYMTVAITAAPAVNSSARKVQTINGISLRKILRPLCCHRGRLEKPSGPRKMQVKVRQVPTMKAANIQCDAVLTMERTETISVGRAIVAPERSSLRIISTGLNQ